MENSIRTSAQASIDLGWHLILLFGLGFTVMLLPDAAMAQTNAIEELFCNIVHKLTGPTGKAIATVAIIAVGIGALLGKISWGMALIVALGVALIFGAATIVEAINGGSISNCSTGNIAGQNGLGAPGP